MNDVIQIRKMPPFPSRGLLIAFREYVEVRRTLRL